MDLTALLESSGAILRGHFILASGRRSDVYFEKFRVLERPDVLSALCAEIAERFSHDDFDAVAGPTTGGIIVAFEVARQLGLPAIYVEKEDEARTLRRGKTLEGSPRILVVDDVLTTGGSLLATADALRRSGGEVAGFACLIQRGDEPKGLGAPLFAAYRVESETWDPADLPPRLAAISPVKPGTSI